jgi:6-phosphogluconolactonase (cycloisomerase 2 family)
MIALLSSIACCYVGCSSGAPDKEALNVLECDTETGAAKIVQTVKGFQGTTYFQVCGDRLYSVFSEMRGGKKRSCAAEFPIGADGLLGEMRRLAELPCEAPCHVAVSPDGCSFAFAAYGSATVGSFRFSDGRVRSAVLPDVGMGNFPGRQKKAYAHFAFYTPGGGKLGAVDLGCDKIHFFDPATMERDEKMTVRADRGDGPRHTVWSKDGKFLFVLNELSNSVMSFGYDGKTFRRVGKWTTLPEGFKDFSKAAAIKLTADGKILMASNRGCDSIAFFAVDSESGRLEPRNIAMLKGSFPRDFELMPGEKFMVVGHKRGNEIQVYRFDRERCALEAVGGPLKAWMPLCFKFGKVKEI